MKYKIGLLSGCSILMSYLVMSPVMSEIAKAFPNADASMVQMLLTISSFTSIPFAMLAGKLAVLFYKKDLILISFGMCVICGITPCFWHDDLVVLLILFGIAGGGIGMLTTLLGALACDYFDGRERSRMMGLQGAFISGGAMLFIFAGGLLGKYGWHRVFYIYFAMIPVFCMLLFCLPKGKLEDKEERKPMKVVPYVWKMCFIAFCFNLFQMVFHTNISFLVSETDIGTTQTASVIIAMNRFAGMFAGVVLSRTITVLKEYTILMVLGASAAGFTIIYCIPSVIGCSIGAMLIGFAFSSFAAGSSCLVVEKVDFVSRAISMAVVSVCSNIGSFLSPIVVNPVTRLWSEKTHSKFAFAAGALLLTGIIVCLLEQKRIKEQMSICRHNRNNREQE